MLRSLYIIHHLWVYIKSHSSFKTTRNCWTKPFQNKRAKKKRYRWKSIFPASILCFIEIENKKKSSNVIHIGYNTSVKSRRRPISICYIRFADFSGRFFPRTRPGLESFSNMAQKSFGSREDKRKAKLSFAEIE